MGQMNPPHISDDKFDCQLDIPGLHFAKNLVQELTEGHGWFAQKVVSSEGPLVSDFVTHGPDFAYSTLGIHIGQDDRLTFFGNTDQTITGHFIDCREDSSSLRKKVSYTFAPSPHRRLVIPRGVAHTFDGLPGIVTRDEPVWYASENNPHWNVNNDLISILRTSEDIPVVSVCKYRFSDDLHNFMTRLSQSVLTEPKAYSTRFKLKIAGEEQYVMFHENTWDNEGRALQPLLNAAETSPVKIRPSKYAITGKASWTLVPSTSSGVADVLLLKQTSGSSDRHLFVHRRTRRWYSFLTNEGRTLIVETLDLRPNSSGFGTKSRFETICDPRICYVIEPGIAYRFTVESDTFVRAESELFVSEDEPRDDIPMFGNDLAFIDPDGYSHDQPQLPSLQCADRIIRRMAIMEGQMLQELFQ